MNRFSDEATFERVRAACCDYSVLTDFDKYVRGIVRVVQEARQRSMVNELRAQHKAAAGRQA